MSEKPNAPVSTAGKNVERNTLAYSSVEDAASFLRVSVPTVKKYERNGLLQPIQVEASRLDGTTETITVYNPKQVKAILSGKDRQKFADRIANDGDTSGWLTRA